MSWWSKANWRKWLRTIHRFLGYFTVGITLVYAISGIILNHKQTRVDPAFKTISVEKSFPAGLTIDAFTSLFEQDFPGQQLNKILPEEQLYRLYLKGGIGQYNVFSGALSFEVYQKKPLVYFINKLHYNQKNYWTTPADFYAGALIFFALSGLFMVRGKNSLLKRGKWYVIAGILLIMIYIWI